MIRQNPVYVDAFGNTFMKQCSQVTIDAKAFNGVRTICSYSKLSWIVHFLQNLLSQRVVKRHCFLLARRKFSLT
jgi:hypothetical protein